MIQLFVPWCDQSPNCGLHLPILADDYMVRARTTIHIRLAFLWYRYSLLARVVGGTAKRALCDSTSATHAVSRTLVRARGVSFVLVGNFATHH